MMTTDEALATAAAGGDRAAFARLLDRVYDRLFGLAYRLTGQRSEAEDLTQDICAALPAKLRGFRGDAKFSTWIYRVTVNAAQDRRRRAATHTKAADGWGQWEANRRAADAEISSQIRWLHETMASLPQDLRDTLALLLDDEMTHAQAAQVLGVSEGTISWRMSEVKKHLRERAEKERRS